MLKRARISLLLATLPASLLYIKWFEIALPVARIAFFALLGFSVISFLFYLFEEEEVMPALETQPASLPEYDYVPDVRIAWPVPNALRVAP